jgi:PAS domain S-box-containing protein
LERPSEPRHGFEQTRAIPADAANPLAPGPLPASFVGPSGPLRTSLEARLREEGFALHDPSEAPERALVVILDAAEDEPSKATETCRIKRAACRDECAIVVVTERSDEPLLRAFVEAGADDLFVLPHDEPRLGPRLAALRRRVTAVRRVAEARRDIARRHDYVHDRAPVILHSIDQDKRLVSVSDGWLEALGYGRDEVLGRPLVDFMTPASRERAQDRLPALFQAGVGRNPYELVRKDGSVLEVMMSALVERDASEAPVRTFAVSTDLSEVRRVEKALSRANRELEALIAAFPDNLYRVSADGTMLEAHLSARSYRPVPTSALVGKSVADLLPEKYVPQLRDAAMRAHATKEIVTLELDLSELHHERPNIREIRIVALPNGQTLALSRDVTEQRLAEAALRQNEARLRALLDSAPVILWAMDRDGVVTLSEGKDLAALGLRPGEIVGKSVFDDAERGASRGFVDMVREALTGREIRGESSLNGVWFDSGLWPLRDDAGEITGVMGVSTNVTERRRAELALRDSERLARAVFENAPIGIQIYGPTGTSVRMNEANRLLIGLPSAEFGVGEFNALTDPLFLADGTAAEFARAYAGEIVELHDRPFDLSAPENTWPTARKHIVLDTILFPIRDGGETHAVVAFCRDVTERRLAAARLFLADRLTSLGTMAAGVAHEINNPLAFILANLEFILGALASGALDEPARLQASQAAAESIEGARRMRAIVRDLSTFARSEDDGDRPGVIDVSRVIDASIRIAQHTIRHRATVERTFAAKAAVLGSEPRLGQVFVNLLVNAAQAMPQRPATENHIRITTRDEGSSVIVEVADNGVGIPPGQLRRVFDPFFTTKPVGEGTGLGLSVCHSIVASLGGEIVARSEPSTGSVFRVTLPAAPGEAPSSAGPPVRTDAAPTDARLRVLFVDDEPFVCAAVRRMVGREFDLVCVTGPEDALVQFDAGERFDAILCDLMMPGASGSMLYRALLELDPSLARRVGFLTGGAFTEDVRAFAMDVSDRLLLKPFEPDALRALVRTLAAGKMLPKDLR